MLLIYTHKITPRIRYVFSQVCSGILQLPVSFTSRVEDFIAHESLKMSYTTKPLGSEFHIMSHQIMFEQGLSEQTFHVKKWGNTKCFFSTNAKSDLPFDIFSASFYLLSRYEEYLPQVRDQYGRFMATESIAFKNGFLNQPVVDLWAFKFRAALQRKFPSFNFPKRAYKVMPIIDVPKAFEYRHRSILRTLGGTFMDLFNLKLHRVYERYLVLWGLRKDPYDTYNYLINRKKTFKSNILFFFLIGEFSTYDKGININRRPFQNLIKHVSDHSSIGLKASYTSSKNLQSLKTDKKMMEAVTHTDLKMMRFSYNKIILPQSYRNLLALEVKEDYTMGYQNMLGFRAGTCTPFRFYDLDHESQTPLQVVPFQLMDFSLLKNKSYLDKKQEVQRMISEIKKVNGTFTFIFHNYTFSNKPRWHGFKSLFNLILSSPDE